MIQVKKNGSFFRGRTQHMLMLSTSLVVDAHSAPCMIWICGCISSNVQLPVVEDHLPISCQQGETKLLAQLETLSWTGSLHLFFGGLTHSFFNGGQVRSLEFNGSGTERGVCSSISSIFDDCLHVQYMTPKKSKPLNHHHGLKLNSFSQPSPAATRGGGGSPGSCSDGRVGPTCAECPSGSFAALGRCAPCAEGNQALWMSLGGEMLGKWVFDLRNCWLC